MFRDRYVAIRSDSEGHHRLHLQLLPFRLDSCLKILLPGRILEISELLEIPELCPRLQTFKYNLKRQTK